MRILCVLVCFVSSFWAQAQEDTRRVVAPDFGQRYALVIGNSTYDWKPLVNPVNDARDVAGALTRAGFSSSNVTLLLNANNQQLRRSVREFVESIRPGDFALLYYSGHGIEIRGENYLLPVDLPSNATEILVQDEAVSAQRILTDLTLQGARVKVLILDACRDNSPAGYQIDRRGIGSHGRQGLAHRVRHGGRKDRQRRAATAERIIHAISAGRLEQARCGARRSDETGIA